MSNFLPDDHPEGRLNILFDSSGIEKLFRKERPGVQYYLIDGKKEIHLREMVDHLEMHCPSMFQFQHSALQRISSQKSRDEAFLAMFGFIKAETKGVNVCPDCLARCIMLYEENLEVLKDLQNAVKAINEKAV